MATRTPISSGELRSVWRVLPGARFRRASGHGPRSILRTILEPVRKPSAAQDQVSSALGIEISQATVAKYMVRRRGTPSQNWRTFLRNHTEGIAAIDMFVVASASFRLLYVMIILGHARREIVRIAVTEHPTAAWISRQVTDAFPWDTAPRYLLRDRDAMARSFAVESKQ